jgi:hypothetical protein
LVVAGPGDAPFAFEAVANRFPRLVEQQIVLQLKPFAHLLFQMDIQRFLVR